MKNTPQHQKAIDKCIELYKGTGWKYIFTIWKFWEEPYTELERLVPKKGKIVDMGCGEGINCNFLALTSKQRKLIGVEIDKKRVAIADKKIPNTSFAVGDATKSIPRADAILFFHVLHHFNSYVEQEKVIENCYKALKKGGKLLIVEIDPKPTLKYWVCWVFDHFFVPWVFEGRFHSNAYFRKSKDWKTLIDSKGFSTRIQPAEAGRPFSNVILDCTRK